MKGYIVILFLFIQSAAFANEGRYRSLKAALEDPNKVKEFLSEKHCRNGLVASSSVNSLHDIQDYGRLPAIAHEYGCAIFDIDPIKAESTQPGSKDNIEKAKVEFNELADNILNILERY